MNKTLKKYSISTSPLFKLMLLLNVFSVGFLKSIKNNIHKFILKRLFHFMDCAVHNEPAYPAGPCDCGYAKAHNKLSSSIYHLLNIYQNGLRNRLRYGLKNLYRRLKKVANQVFYHDQKFHQFVGQCV